MHIENPFHEGELLVQERLGEADEGRRNGRAIADSIVRGAFKFVEQQPFVVVGSVDGEGAAWASLVFGAPGFSRVLDERVVEIDLGRAAFHDADPLLSNLRADPRVGMLYIEPGSRRRFRINGTVEREGDRLRVAVDEAYPNCPKYIQRRQLRTNVDLDEVRTSERSHGSSLGDDQLAMVRAADTLFVASSNPAGGTDASHRGGNAGFVEIVDERTLFIPDYPGNHMYNTLGNFAVNPRAGLTFLDFESGRMLLTTGSGEIVWEREGHEEETGGTNRFWRFSVDEWLSFELPIQLEWEFLDASPFNPVSSSRG